jgi:hypothetical protein
MPNLVGIGLSQVPTNSMLGGLAYQDPEHASIKDLDLKNLSQINSEIADTATDIFVYDTRKDSDGGAWRKRTQHTSWYNETLGTATRGTRREFPAVAVIVSTTTEVTIYDGDDPNLPMWMVFDATTSNGINNVPLLQYSGQNGYPTAALNGVLVLGQRTNGDNWGSPIINFISEYIVRMDPHSTEGGIFNGGVAQRHDNVGFNSPGKLIIVNSQINDVSMTVLPNAPIDDATGLPVPTIAVATDGGVSVIKDDGTVVDHTDVAGGQSTQVSFTQDGKLAHSHDGHTAIRIDSLKSSDFSYGANKVARNNSEEFYINYSLIASGWSGNVPKLNTGAFNSGGQIVPIQDNILAERANTGLNLLARDFPSSPNNNRVAYATTSYNTGWMHGDIKGAFLSDTDTTNLVDTNLVSNGTFDSNTTGWSSSGNITVTQDSGRLKMVSGAGNPFVYTAVTCVVGKRYYVQLDVQGEVSFHAGPNASSSGDVAYIPYGSYGSSTTKHCFFVATATTMYLVPHVIGTGNTGYVDNVICKLADHDRSVYGSVKATVGGVNGISSGLATYGTITKSAVATGAELVAYSGFSASNYLAQPYNSDLNPGSGSYSVVAWFKTESNNSGSGIITGLGNSDSDEVMIVYVNSSYGIYFDYGTSTEYVYLSNSNDRSMVRDGNWHQVVCQVTAGQIGEIYIDGIKKSTTQNVAAPSTWSQWDTNYRLYVGCGRGLGTLPFSGSISLVRYSLSKMSTEQIKKIYEDEKVLFQENAACTLYGSSDAVTALAYDSDTNLLYAGTSSGRSDFQGLRRINNTTTAVTTAISASNGLVAEQ